jgi:glycosyltransferase involved in cell wall biosynthesis
LAGSGHNPVDHDWRLERVGAAGRNIKMSEAAKVAVIIPVFNGEATIAAAIDSALAQEFAGRIELVVVNDGSTDGTAGVLQAYRDRVTVLDRVNGGPAAARNAGVKASHGEYVAFLDADDIWMPGKLAKTLAALESDSSAAMVYTNASLIGAGGESLGTTYTPVSEKHAPAIDDMLWGLWNILPSTAMMKRATFDAIGGFREEFATGHPQWEDSYFMILAREHGRFIYLDEPTVLYRVAASVEDSLKRRRVWKDGAKNAETIRVDRYTRNSELMQRLVRERFGDRAVRLIGAIRRATAGLLVSVGLTAMLDDDRAFARRCYRLALHYDRFNAKTYVRLAWTYLPERIARTISAALPPRLQRAVCGPAHA